jgi:azurin
MSETYTGLAEAIADAVNGNAHHAGKYATNIQGEHNALQQLMFDEVFKAGVIALAAQDYTDARNERAVAECREICDRMGYDYDD